MEKIMDALTKEQREYMKLKTQHDRFAQVYTRMRKAGELGCFSHDLPDGYPKPETILEILAYQRLEQLKQEQQDFLNRKV